MPLASMQLYTGDENSQGFVIFIPKDAMNLRISIMFFTRNRPTSTGFFLAEVSEIVNDKKSLLDGSELLAQL